MICSNVKHLLHQHLKGQHIIDIYYNNLSEEFQSINEYDSIDIIFSDNSILRVQSTLRILYENNFVLLSNNRFLNDEEDLLTGKYALFNLQLNKTSLLTTNSQIINIAFTDLGDMRFITNTGFEFQVLIDTRRTDCTSYELWNFDLKSRLCVFCQNGKIVGALKGRD